MEEENSTPIPAEEITSPDPLLPQEGEPAPSSAVDINPSESVTEIRTPETVTITEVMEPARSPTSGEFLKSLLPKLKERLIGRTEKRLSKILELAREKGEIQNDDVEKLLHVSDASATNYLKKLVDRGQLKVSGNTKGVKYSAT